MKKKSVLIVESNPEQSLLLETIFQDSFIVFAAEHYEKALLYFEHFEIHCVITDLGQIKMWSGIDFVVMIKNININIPLIICSSFLLNQDAASTYMYEAFALLKKPIENKPAIETMRRLKDFLYLENARLDE